MRSADGGGRLKIDIDQSDMAAINRLLDLAVARKGVVFAAAVVPVREDIALTGVDHATEEDPKRSTPILDRRRFAKRRD